MADGMGRAMRALQALYAAAVGDDVGPMTAAVTSDPGVRTRVRLEEYAFAYACARARRPGPPGGQAATFPRPTVDTVEPLTDAQVYSACKALALKGPGDTVLCRAVVFALCSAAHRAIEWLPLDRPVNPAHRARVIRAVTNASKACTYSTYGDTYVNVRVRMALPRWASCTTPHGHAPYEVVAELLGSQANDAVRPILDNRVALTFNATAWSAHHLIGVCACAAVATLQEITGGYPKLYLNEAIGRHVADADPAIALVSDFGGIHGWRIGVLHHGTISCNLGWEKPVADCIAEYLITARESGVMACSDLVSCIIDGSDDAAASIYTR